MMNQEKYQALLERLLRFTDDSEIEFWVVFDWLAEAMEFNLKKITVAQGEALWVGLNKLVTMMLENGLIAFDFSKVPGQAIPWPEQEPKQVLTEIRNRWVACQGHFPDAGFIVWFYKIKTGPLNPG